MIVQKWWILASCAAAAATVALGGACAVEVREYEEPDAGTGGTGGAGGQGGAPGCVTPGAEGCPCVTQPDCAPGLACEAGACVDPLPLCGNGSIDPGEECDDGNDVPEDGCGLACRFEEVCLVNHLGGNPSVVSSIHIAQDGTMSLVDLRVLDGSHTIGLWPFRQRAAARCGHRVYFALQTSDTIEAVEVTPSGKLLPVEGVTGLPNVAGLLCDDKNNILYAMAHTDTVELHAYAIDASGKLGEVDMKQLVFPVSSLDTVAFTMHPQLQAFYVFGGSSGGPLPGESKLVGASVRFSAGGMMLVDQPSVTVAMNEGFFHTTLLSTDGTFMGFTGYSGGGFANFELDASGKIPVGTPPLYSGMGFSNGYDAVAIDGDFFYHSHSEANVSACRFNAGGMAGCLSTTPTTGGLNRLYLAYGGSMLVAASGYGGAIDTFKIEEDKTVLKQLGSFLLDKTESFHASALVPCSPAP